MRHVTILLSSVLCQHALGEWWIGSDVWRNLSTYGPLEAMGALSRWRQCPLHDFALGQRHEVILNTMIRRFSIHDEIKRPEYFPCTNILDQQMPDVPAWTMSDAEAKARRSGYDTTGADKVLFAVALVRSNEERSKHVFTNIVPHVPGIIVFNATEKTNPAQMEHDYRSIGLTMGDSLGEGEAAWWLTEMRLFQMILASDVEYGVILQDDAVIPSDFVDSIHRLIATLAPEEQRVAYRLSAWDYGLLVPRRAIPRILGKICSDTIEWPTDSYSFKHVGCCQLFFDGRPFNGLVSQRDELPTQLNFHGNALKSARGTSKAYNPPSPPIGMLQAVPNHLGGLTPLCQADYPGKVYNFEALVATFDPSNDLRTVYNLAYHNHHLG